MSDAYPLTGFGACFRHATVPIPLEGAIWADSGSAWCRRDGCCHPVAAAPLGVHPAVNRRCAWIVTARPCRAAPEKVYLRPGVFFLLGSRWRSPVAKVHAGDHRFFCTRARFMPPFSATWPSTRLVTSPLWLLPARGFASTDASWASPHCSAPCPTLPAQAAGIWFRPGLTEDMQRTTRPRAVQGAAAAAGGGWIKLTRRWLRLCYRRPPNGTGFHRLLVRLLGYHRRWRARGEAMARLGMQASRRWSRLHSAFRQLPPGQ